MAPQSQRHKDLMIELDRRWSRVEQDKQRIWQRYDDIYRLVMPNRHRQNDFDGHSDTLDEMMDSTALIALQDFASDMLSGFTPPFTDEWIKFEPSKQLTLDAGQKRVFAAALEDYKSKLWAAIQESNFSEAVREAYKDLAVGTAVLMITDRHPAMPLVCEAIPVSDVWLDRGPGGEIDGVFRKFKPRAEHIPVMFPGAVAPKGVSPETPIEVREGTWRDWSDPGVIKHKYVIAAGGDVLLESSYEGDGACPFIVTRWDTDSTTAWGTGPLWTALPDIKTLNDAVDTLLRVGKHAVNPPTLYDDDGIIDVSDGVEAGTWIPRAPGSKVDALEPMGAFDFGFLQADKLKDSIKRALFQDRPEQRGLTPPTATQWLDQAQDLARRMGAPAGTLVRRWQIPIIKRFAYLLAKRGEVPEVKFGKGAMVELRPTSALVMSQDQEKAMRARQFAQEIAALSGQLFPMIFNVQQYADVQARHANIADLGLIRSPQEQQAMMQQGMQMAQQVQQGQQGGGNGGAQGGGQPPM